MQSRTNKWLGRLAEGLGVATLLALAGCYATARPGVVYTTEPEPVYYAPAQAQVRVQRQDTYYVEPAAPATTVYVQQQPPPVTTVYVQPQPVPPTTVYVGGGHPGRGTPVHGNGGVHVGAERGRGQRPGVNHQGGAAPVPGQGRGEDDDDHDDEHGGRGHGRSRGH